MSSGFTVTFWGVRGTVPCPGPETARYGGNTACIEVRCGDTLLIFDAGTGLRPLGRELIRANADLKAHIFLTHTHLDHIMGMPFFKPAYAKGNQLELWSGHLRRQRKTLREVLFRIMEAPYFPVPMNIMHSCIAFHDFEAGEPIEIGDTISLRTIELNHPGGATGYRVNFAGRSFCYVSDTEHREGELDKTIIELIAGSDIVVYDATYTDKEYPHFRGWGHSTWQEGVRLCEAAGAGRLVTFHHDPAHDDQQLDTIAGELERLRPGSIVAREGLVLRLA